MNNETRFYWGQDDLSILLGARTDLQIRVVFLVEFLILTGLATSFLFPPHPFQVLSTSVAVATLSVFLYLVAVSRLVSRVHFHETIVLDALSITLQRRSLFSTHAISYSWTAVEGLRYQRALSTLPDPIETKLNRFWPAPDKFGRQKSVNCGRLCLLTKNGRLCFAAGIAAEEAVEIAGMMKVFAGARLELSPELSLIFYAGNMNAN